MLVSDVLESKLAAANRFDCWCLARWIFFFSRIDNR